MRRGWALAAGVLLGVPAIALQPSYPIAEDGVWTHALFGAAALLFVLLAAWPDQRWLRHVASAVGVFATSLRAMTIALDVDFAGRARLVAIASWLFASLYCTLVPALTERFARQGRDSCWPG